MKIPTPSKRPASSPRRAKDAKGVATASARRQGKSTAEPARWESSPPNIETVLLAVTGMSPAVLTETVWGLAHEAEPVIPTRVIAVTTRDGRRELERQLFTPDPRLGDRCPWDALREALAAEGHELGGRLRFGATGDDVRVITATDAATGRSRELSDLRTPADNEAAADFLLEQVRGIVENPDTRLIASLAGGRKTMGALLYACLTLAGRETDRLTHVLVSEPFETLRGFWFPGQPGGALLKAESGKQKVEMAAAGSQNEPAESTPRRPSDSPAPAHPALNGPSPAATSFRCSPSNLSPPRGEGEPQEQSGERAQTFFDPATAVVELAEVPFVPLRNLFLRELGQPAGSFQRLLSLCRANVRLSAGEHLKLEIETTRPHSLVNSRRLELGPREHLVLLFFARRAKQGEIILSAYDEALVDLNLTRKELRASAPANDWSDWRNAPALDREFTERDLTRVLSDLRAKARRAAGGAALLGSVLPEKGRVALDVPGSLIFIKD